MQNRCTASRPIVFTFICASLGLVACGGTTVFSSQSPVMVAGAPPPPPPPPPVEAPPPEPPPKVIVKDNKIEITEKIQFEYNKATILEASFPLLQEIADTIKKNPHIKKIGIEGHASSEGSDAHNLKLSDQRAKAVMQHLVEKGGLKAEMFTAKGYGETKPIADNATEEGRETNRRVEFNILEQDVTKKKVEVTAAGEKVVEEKTTSVTTDMPAGPAKDDKAKDEKKDSAQPAMPEKKKKDDTKKELK